MIALLLALARLFRALRHAFQDAEFRALLALAATLLALGTVFYHFQEGWTFLDSAFFSLITLTTVGYGNLVPTTTLSKIFTMVYLVLGISVLVGFLNNLAGKMLEAERARQDRKSSARAEPPASDPPEAPEKLTQR